MVSALLADKTFKRCKKAPKVYLRKLFRNHKQKLHSTWNFLQTIKFNYILLQNKSTFQFPNTLSHYICTSTFHHDSEAINLYERANCTEVCMWKFKGQDFVFLAQITSFKLKHLIVHEFRFLCANFFYIYCRSPRFTSDPFFYRRFYAYLSDFPSWKTVRMEKYIMQILKRLY